MLVGGSFSTSVCVVVSFSSSCWLFASVEPLTPVSCFIIENVQRTAWPGRIAPFHCNILHSSWPCNVVNGCWRSYIIKCWPSLCRLIRRCFLWVSAHILCVCVLNLRAFKKYLPAFMSQSNAILLELVYGCCVDGNTFSVFYLYTHFRVTHIKITNAVEKQPLGTYFSGQSIYYPPVWKMAICYIKML